jgi:isopentenyldiphosphate isomerase
LEVGLPNECDTIPNMNELLEVYKLDDTFLGNQNRKEFYDEIKKEFSDSGVISKKVKAVRILLMNSLGRIYLQKRSGLKDENPNLYDKTVGGHVTAGNTFELTVVKECAEELGFPATVLSDEEFKQAIKTIDLTIIGIFKKVDYISDFKSLRILGNGNSFVQPFMTEIYIGYYNGPIKFADGESCGVETFSIDKLRENIVSDPNKFTGDIKFMADKYSDLLVPIT